MRIFSFAISDDHFGIPIEAIAFIEGRWDTITGRTGAPSYIKGIITLHGLTVPIYDLALQLGYAEQKLEYVVVLDVKGAKIGLAISGASEVITVDEKAIHPVPVVVSTARHFIKSIVFYQESLISLIDVNRLIPPDAGYPGGTGNEI